MRRHARSNVSLDATLDDNESIEVKAPPGLQPVTEAYIRALRVVGAREHLVKRVEQDRARVAALLKTVR